MTTSSAIFGFMHVARVNDWRRIVEEQFLKLRASGLLERSTRIFIGFVGEEGGPELSLPEKVEVAFTSPDLRQAERPTLIALQEFCRRTDCLVYYIHTKGVINSSSSTRQWRHSMEHFVIHRHADCIARLQDHDVCGINWADRGWCRFFGGNFWWARSEYVRTLPDLATLQPIQGKDPEGRHVCERWIGENTAVRAACLFDSQTDHYAGESLPRSRYASVHDVARPSTGRSNAIDATLWDGLENRFQDLLDPVDPIGLVVQLGVGDGYALYCLSAALPRAAIIVVDSHRKPSPDFLRMMPNVIFLRTSSESAAVQIAGTIDVLHLGKEVGISKSENEIKRWSGQLRPGGCVLVSGANDDSWFGDVAGRKATIAKGAGLGAWYKPVG